mgnify:FL=1
MNNKVLNARHILLSTVLFSSAAGLVFFGNAAVEGAKNGMVLCADLLVPSIFPFMCLCSLICASGGGELVSKITRAPFGFFFPGLSDFSYIYIMSLLGGYPFAASCLGPLFESGKISKAAAQKLLLFCFCPTPAFCIIAVGQGIYGSSAVGLVVFLSCLVSSFVFGVVICRIKRARPTVPVFSKNDCPFSAAFVAAVASASKSVIIICAVAVFCSALVGALSAAVGSPIFTSVLTCLFETTSAVKYLSANGSVYAVAAICSFGGISVFLQIAALAKELFPRLWLFVLCRVLSAALCCGLCAGLMKMFKISVPTLSSAKETASAALRCSPVPAVFLVLCALVLVVWVEREVKKEKL